MYQSRIKDIEAELALLGYGVEASLSSLDSEDSCDALIDLTTGDLMDPPNEYIAELVAEWGELLS